MRDGHRLELNIAACLLDGFASAGNLVATSVVWVKAATGKPVVVALVDVDNADLVVLNDEAAHCGTGAVADVLVWAPQSEGWDVCGRHACSYVRG